MTKFYGDNLEVDILTVGNLAAKTDEELSGPKIFDGLEIFFSFLDRWDPVKETLFLNRQNITPLHFCNAY
jgi:hypothetical protein